MSRTLLSFAWFALGLSSAAVAVAESSSYEITVAAGKHDRQSVPVRVALPASGVSLQSTTVQLKGDDVVTGQVTAQSLVASGDSKARREVHFILPSLKAGETRTYRLDLSDAAGREGTAGYIWQEASAGEADLKFDGPVLKYVHPTLDETSPQTREQTYKPFHHVYSPDGSRIVTKGPGGKYTHHRGLYFGFNRISYGDGLTCDVWHCKAPAHQAHEKVLEKEEGFVLGRHRLAIGWHGAKGEKFADEQRELTAYNAAGGQVIDFASVVRTAGGPIKLNGDPQHSGFHFRADNEVAESTSKQTYFLRPDGKGGPGETRNWTAKDPEAKATMEPWKVMSFVLGDKRYSVLRIEHPENPGEWRSSERDYGRVGAYFEYEVTPKAPLEVRYRVVLKEGEFTKDEAEQLAADFADPPQVTVREVK